MIDQLYEDIRKLAEPSKLVDVRLHECILGEIDVQKDYVSNGTTYKRSTSRDWGDILVDRGSERIRIRVPRYTHNVKHAFDLLPRRTSFVLSYIPKGHPFFLGTSMQWAAVMRDERLDPIMSAHHDSRPAFAVCELAVMWAMRGKV